MTPGRAGVTCAAFSPDATHDLVAVGTQTGGVHFWSMATVSKGVEWLGTIVAITEVDSRSSQIRVEVNNPGGIEVEQLKDRSTATIIIDPTAPARPVPVPVPPLKLNVPGVGARPLPPDGIIQAGATVPAKPLGDGTG